MFDQGNDLYLDQLEPIPEPVIVSVLRFVACGTGRGRNGQMATGRQPTLSLHGYASVHEDTHLPTDLTTRGMFDGKIHLKTWMKFSGHRHIWC